MVEHKTPIEKKSGKKINFRQHKKTVLGGGLVAVLAIAGIFSGIIILSDIDDKKGESIVRLGTFDYPSTFDPIASWFYNDVAASIIPQMAEGLFKNSFTNGGSTIVNNLATSYEWSIDDLNLTCTLRSDVKFHDNTPFNAQAVKWNFDRIQDLTTSAPGSYIWKLPSDQWILNKTEVIDEYQVKFVLNQPFAPFLSLLASRFTYIVSPTSTPSGELIGNNPDDLYGTGPFRYDSHLEDMNIELGANQDYWDGIPNIDKIIITVYSNWSVLWEAVKAKEMSYNRLWLNDEEIEELKNITGITTREYAMLSNNYLNMNNEKINSTMRKAISYAINYTHYIEEIRALNETRMRSPIPKPVIYSNWEDFNVPYCNISLARQTLIDIGWNGTTGLTANSDISPGNEWEILADGSFPLSTYDFRYTDRVYFMSALAQPLPEYLRQIGLKIETVNVSYGQYWGELFGIWGYERNLSKYELFVTGWNPDYNDPHHVIHTTFSNEYTIENYAQFNDSLTQQWMEEALVETNETERAQLYINIQRRLIEDLYPMAWLHQDVRTEVYLSNMKGDPFKDPFKFYLGDVKFE